MSWNYRIIKKDNCLFIAEVYYNEKSEIYGYADASIQVSEEEATLENLKIELDRISNALTLPILEVKVEEEVYYVRKEQEEFKPFGKIDY